MKRAVSRASLVLVAAALALPGCASKKREECRALTTLINTGAERIDKAQASLVDPTGLKALADVLDKSATEAGALPLTAPDLQKHAQSYAALVRDVAKTAREMAAAGEAGDVEKAKAAGAAMEKLVGDEPRLIGEVNKLCSAE